MIKLAGHSYQMLPETGQFYGNLKVMKGYERSGTISSQILSDPLVHSVRSQFGQQGFHQLAKHLAAAETSRGEAVKIAGSSLLNITITYSMLTRPIRTYQSLQPNLVRQSIGGPSTSNALDH